MIDKLRRRTTAAQVAEALEVAVLAGEFERGHRIPTERKLSSMLGVSRCTLREGVSRLVAKGLLVAIPGQGTFVSSQDVALTLQTMPGIYTVARAERRRVDIVRHYLELRRFTFASVLMTACRKASTDDVAWIEDAIIRFESSAGVQRDLDAALRNELAAIQVAAERTDLYGFWLLMNHLTEFFRVARKDLKDSLTLQMLEERGSALRAMLRNRDADGIARYFEKKVAPQDASLIAELSRRVDAEIASQRNAPPVPTPPPPIAPCEAFGEVPGARAFCHATAGEPLPAARPVPSRPPSSDPPEPRGEWEGPEEGESEPDLPVPADPQTGDDPGSTGGSDSGQGGPDQAGGGSSPHGSGPPAASTTPPGGSTDTSDCPVVPPEGYGAPDPAPTATDPGRPPEPPPPGGGEGEAPLPKEEAAPWDEPDPALKRAAELEELWGFRAPYNVPKPGPRDDPDAWYPIFLAWYRRTYGRNPWEDPDLEPPGEHWTLWFVPM